MAAIAGKGGKVVIGSDTVAFVENWTLNIGDEALETTGLGASARTYIGRALYEATADLTWRALDNSDTATAAIRAAALTNSGSVTLKLYQDGTKYWTGTAFLTSFSQDTSVDGLVGGSCSATYSGGVTYT